MARDVSDGAEVGEETVIHDEARRRRHRFTSYLEQSCGGSAATISPMRASDVIDLLRRFERQGLDVHVDGGWAVDALLGTQTRPHDDLDIAIPHAQVGALRRLLAPLGFIDHPRDDARDCNFVLAHEDRRRLDVHSYTLDDAGRNIFGIPYQPEHLVGVGCIDGHQIRCVEPHALVRFHTGYEPDANDVHDVRLLCERFDIALPAGYRLEVSSSAGSLRGTSVQGMNADAIVACSLEAPPELLPFLPELLADLDELGSDAEQIAGILRDLALPSTARVVDLGCGKGATAIAIASTLRLRVLGVDLFEPFVAHANAAATAANVHHLCECRHGDVRTMADRLPPSDVAVFAALGDVLGDPAETIRVVRHYVRPGGYVLLADVFLRDGGSIAFPGFERYRSKAETVRGWMACGDEVVREILEIESDEEGDDDEDGDVAAIRSRAVALAERYPERREQFLAFAAYQAKATAHIAANLVDAIWVLRRSAM